MGEVIQFPEYKARKNAHPRDGIQMEVVFHSMLIRYYREGILIGEERIVSELFLRDLLDSMNCADP